MAPVGAERGAIDAERRRLGDQNCRQAGCPQDVTHSVVVQEFLVHDSPRRNNWART